MAKIILFCVLSLLACAAGQRITTIHLDGVQYFISRMNPYSPELNYFLAYQYCRSLGLQLASFETKEKAESMTTYLKNAGYGNYDFWTSGNRLGTGMFLWMSTGLPFNATFDFFENSADAIQAGLLDPVDHNSNTSPQRTARDSSGAEKGCVILKQPTLKWMPEDCSDVKDFICEQTRCYYYNYGSIPVSSAQGRPITSTTPRPPVSLLNLATTTPLPLIMSTSGSMFAKAKSSVGDNAADASQQPSTVWFKLNHDRSLVDAPTADMDAELEADVEEHDDADGETDFDEHEQEHEHEHEHEHDASDVSNEHARELNDADDVKEHVFPLNDNELHNEMHSIEELQLQLQAHGNDEEHQEADEDNQETSDDNSSVEHEAEVEHEVEHEAEAETDSHNDVPAPAVAAPPAPAVTMPSSTESPGIEVRLKQIAQDFEKMTSSQELQRASAVSKDEITPQSSLSLSDLIRTLRPNEQQIIPQIDSDYSNAMRVLGKTSAVVVNNNNNNNDDSRKFKVLPEPHSY
ncbi:putative uncharacterized protein DDB_G0271982 isoform X2 [Drosophila albomicans]|uniref:C-type lectin domain-containing protein n=2 Tax=Drosophila albomicans TaxID=7291 RepID=A0A6P8XA15_DROAB|nr:putative uncharacterized protein DDB_G0271982 isoform X2 [Drosophila albomicans]